jgi:hypothetical protein
MYHPLAKTLIAFGACLIIIGVILLISGRTGVLGELPGDIHFQKKNLEFRFPVATCIVASVILSLLLSAVFLWSKK